MNKLFKLIFNEDGGMAEYALLLALIVITAIVVITAVGNSICQMFSNASSALI